MTVRIDLTNAEWEAVKGWAEAAQHNAEDMLGASGLDAVAWAERAGQPIPGDVDRDGAQAWVHYERMKGRIARRQPTLDDLRDLDSYGEAISMDEIASRSADRSAWEKIYPLVRTARNPRKRTRPLTEEEFSEVFHRVESTAENMVDDDTYDSVEDGWDSASDIVSAQVSEDVKDWVDYWELGPSILEVGASGINDAVGFTTYEEYLSYYRDYVVGSKGNPTAGGFLRGLATAALAALGVTGIVAGERLRRSRRDEKP